MKILILANNDVGLYRFRKHLIEKLINAGNEIYISLPYGELVEELEKMGCNFIDTPMERRGMNPLQDWKLLRRYQKLMRQLSPDMVITYTIKPNIYGGMAAAQCRIPYVMNITGLGTMFQKENLLKKLVVILYKIACKNVKVVFFENEGNRQVFTDNKIVPEEKTYKLNGAGVDIEEYGVEKYPENDSVVRFLYLGRVMKEKGIDIVLDAYLKLRDTYNVELDIVGPYEEGYGNRVEELAAQGIVNYHGFQTDVKRFIRDCHCLVLPSYHEGMANSLLEAGAMGRPLITSNIHGCKEAVNGRNGYLTECGDAQELYKKMLQFIDLPYEQKQNMGAESRKHIAETFSKEKVVEETIRRMME